MKKIIKIIFVLLVIFFAYLIYTYKQYLPEIPSRLAIFHNTGEINVTINNKKINLDEKEISFYINNEFHKATKINDGKFKFIKGVYGINAFCFEIPNEENSHIPVEFGHFNTNWWHKVKYKIDINIITNEDSTLTSTIKQEIFYDKDIFERDEKTQIINKNEKIKIHMGP